MSPHSNREVWFERGEGNSHYCTLETLAFFDVCRQRISYMSKCIPFIYFLLQGRFTCKAIAVLH
jgi:hypothetical protein